MDEREQQRRIKHRLAVLRHAEEVSGNVAATCRYYGISRPTFYKWLRQLEEFGDVGLRDRSSRPRTCPHQTDADASARVLARWGLSTYWGMCAPCSTAPLPAAARRP
jgi:transposase-like protein